MGHGVTVKVVDDEAFATGCGTLHLHHAVAGIEGNNEAVLAQRLTGFLVVQLAVNDLVGNVDALDAAPLAVAELLGQFLGIALLAFRNPVGEGHHLYQLAVFGVFLGCRQVQVFDGHRRRWLYGALYKNHLRGALLQRHPRSAERPAGAGGHVEFNAVELGLLLRVAQHLHPLVGEVVDVVCLIALHTVEWGDFYGSDAMLGILAQVPL